MITEDIQIRFGDVDGLRHVNNASIVEYYDIGLSSYFDKLGLFSSIDGVGVAKVNVVMNFFDSILLEEAIEVRTKVKKIGNKSLTFHQEIVNKEDGRVKSDCLTIMAGFCSKNHKSAEISYEWKKIIKEHENIFSE